MGSITEVEGKREQRLRSLQERLRHDPGLPVANPTAAYWQSPAARFQKTQLPMETDIVIIGSGITGCSIAKHILENSSSTKATVIEARTVCSGATGRNGGHVKSVPEHTYGDHISLGRERTREIMLFTLTNVEAILNLLPTLSPELQQASEIRKVESLNLFTDESVFEEFKSLVEAFGKDNPDLKSRGQIITPEELQSEHGVHNAVGGYLSSAGAAWPYRLITGVFAALLERHGDRLAIMEHCPVESVEYQENSYRVRTSQGTVKTNTVIHATNGHAGHLLPGLRGPLFPVRGQMSTQIPSGSFANKYQGKRSWSIHYDAGFDYITQSGATGEIFHGGGLAQSIERGLGELGNTSDDTNSVQAVAHLGGALNATFGIERSMSDGIKATWTGVMGFTTDGLPFVGRVPSSVSGRNGNGEWVGAGFNGYGMANSWLCGKHIAESVLGNADAEPVPYAYKISEERIGSMSAAAAAQQWFEKLGLR